MGRGAELLQKIVDLIIQPTILVVFTLGLFLFFWGIIEYLWEIKDGKTNGNGRQHMLWGLVGMLIMISVGGIISIVTNTLGIDVANPDVSRIQNVNPGVRFQ